MGYIDRIKAKIICEDCQIQEEKKVLDMGSSQSGSYWQSFSEFKYFNAITTGGDGPVEPDIVSATCKRCNKPALVNQMYQP